MARLLKVLIMIFIVTASVTNVIASSSSSSSSEDDSSSEDEDDIEQTDFRSLLQIARKLNQEHIPPKTTVCILGQSLAWIGKILEIQEEYRPTGNNFIYVPFSGYFLKSDRINYYTSKNAELPTAEEIKNYRALLQRLKADPESIIARYKSESRKTVLTDQVGSGKGLSSYLYVLYSWAKEKSIVEDLNKALQVVIVVYNDLDETVSHFNIDAFSIPCKVMKVSPYTLRKVVQPEVYRGFERLVISYKHRDWIKQASDVTLEGQPINVNKINRLREFIMNDLGIYTTTTKATVPSTSTSFPKSDPEDNVPSFLEDFFSEPFYTSCKRSRRAKRDADESIKKTPLILKNYLNSNLYKTLLLEYKKSNTPFENFIKEEMENPSSSLNKIVDEACNAHRKQYYDLKPIGSSNVHFSQNEKSLSSCIEHYQGFRSNDFWKGSDQVVKNIANSAAGNFAGRTLSKQNVTDEIKNLVDSLQYYYPEYVVKNFVEAIEKAALRCAE